MDDPRPGYHSYLVRISPARSPEGWRAMLYHAQSGERRHFASLELLFAYLAASGQPGALSEANEASGTPCSAPEIESKS